MPIFDIILFALVAVVLLGLAWLSEKIKDWLWSRLFKFLGFLLQTAIGLGLCFAAVVLVGIYVFTDWIPHLTPSEVQSPYWFRLMLWGAAVVAACSLAYSGIRRLLREEGSEQLTEEPVRWNVLEPEPEPFPWKSLLKFEAVYMPLSSVIFTVLYYRFGPAF